MLCFEPLPLSLQVSKPTTSFIQTQEKTGWQLWHRIRICAKMVSRMQTLALDPLRRIIGLRLKKPILSQRLFEFEVKAHFFRYTVR